MEAGDISVLIPYQSDGGPRDEALRFVRSFYKRMLPEAEICVGELTGETFSRSKAINKAASAATGSRWIIADGDLIYDPELIRGALRQLREDNWIIPFTSITRLTLSNSQSAYRSEAVWPLQIPVETKPDDARYFVGGVSVVTRTAFETIGGYDERFIGWGGEDEALPIRWIRSSENISGSKAICCIFGIRSSVLQAIRITAKTMRCSRNTERRWVIEPK